MYDDDAEEDEKQENECRKRKPKWRASNYEYWLINLLPNRVRKGDTY